jgi:ABC-type branched-subunit amino acid transport system ATPase component
MLDPGLILLDEPAAGINPTLISRLLSVIQKLKAQGKRFLIIEHNMDVVIRLCDWVYVLDAGTPIAEGPPEKIKKDPVVLEAYFGK